MAHNNGKFSVMALTTLLLVTISVSSGNTKLSVLGTLVCLVHRAPFKSALSESSLGGQGDSAGTVVARAPGQGVPHR